MAEYDRKESTESVVAGTKIKKRREKKVWKKRKKVTYFPRKQLIFDQPKSKTHIDRQYVTISPHTVRGHLRRLAKPHWKASEQAIENAKEFGMNLRDGHTFVKPHERGEVEQLRARRDVECFAIVVRLRR